MKVIYIAGPFRGSNGWIIEQNVRAAEAAGLEVAKLGAMPLIPHCNTRFFHGVLSDEFFVEGTLALMLRCDAVLFLNTWRNSAGCRGEYDVCRRHNIPTFASLMELQNWLERQSRQELA